MRTQLTFSLILVCCFACNGQQATQLNDISKIKWLEGTWNRLNTSIGTIAHERWMENSPNEWIGWGVTLKGSDTTFVEKLKIVKKDNSLYYVADVTENPEPVYFKFTTLTKSGFVCENPDHDFPKKIAYNLNGKIMTAIISGDGKSSSFRFEKKP